MSKVMNELCILFETKYLHTSVYHPQKDGLVERLNKTLKIMLKNGVNKDGMSSAIFVVCNKRDPTVFHPLNCCIRGTPKGCWILQKKPGRLKLLPTGVS